MKRGGPIQRRTPMPQQRKPLPRQSAKAKALAPVRKAFRDAQIEANPWCQIRWDDGCQGRAVDVDEPLSRAQGGSIVDPANSRTGCRHCHTQKHLHPTEAERRGLTVQRRHLPDDKRKSA